MTMRRIFIDADVRHHDEVRDLIFECPNGPLDNSIRIIRGRSPFIFMNGKAEEHDRRNAKPMGIGRFFDEKVKGPPTLTGHRRNGFRPVRAFPDEKGIHEVTRGERGFPHHPPERFGLTQSAHSLQREGHGLLNLNVKRGSAGRSGRGLCRGMAQSRLISWEDSSETRLNP